jgi:hypothetical protein
MQYTTFPVSKIMKGLITTEPKHVAVIKLIKAVVVCDC